MANQIVEIFAVTRESTIEHHFLSNFTPKTTFLKITTDKDVMDCLSSSRGEGTSKHGNIVCDSFEKWLLLNFTAGALGNA